MDIMAFPFLLSGRLVRGLLSIYSGFPQAKDSAVPANRPNLSFDVDRLSSTP